MKQTPGKMLVACCMLFLITACSKSDIKSDCSTALPQKFDTKAIQASMKGWELYSWPSTLQTCSDWNYAILPASNSLKSYDLVTNDNVLLQAVGQEQLKSLLNKFPSGEHISWMGENWLSATWGLSNLSHKNLALPPLNITEEIRQHCSSLQLDLIIHE